MKETIQSTIENAGDLEEIKDNLLQLFREMKSAENISGLGYVAGIITSDGPEFMGRNLSNLARYTDILKQLHDFPIISATEVFTPHVFSRIPEMQLPRNEREVRFLTFWRQLLSSGHFTDIFRTPRWNHSNGAIDEHRVAKEVNLKIHYVDF